MMYRSFPTLDAHERLGLAELMERPVYRCRRVDGQVATVFADDGERVSVDEVVARAVAGRLGKGRPRAWELLNERDQWTPTASYVPHLPLHRVALDDDAGTSVYVSSTSGEIVQVLDFSDKLWAWLGAIPHWIYFRDLRVHQGAWEWTVIVLSGIGVFMCIAGMVIGIAHYRRRPGSMAFSPYSERWFRWHHYTGFFFGIFVFTWTLSGLLSMNPFDWSPSRSLTVHEQRRFMGGELDPARFALDPADAIRAFRDDGTVKVIELVQVQGRAFYLAHYDANETRLLAAEAAGGATLKTLDELRDSLLIEALGAVNASDVLDLRKLTAYDAYYYSEDGTRALPVLRFKLDDPVASWYYVSPKTGAVVDRYQTKSRWNRWLYHGLHSFDFPFLLGARPHWDIVMLTLMPGGTAVSATGLGPGLPLDEAVVIAAMEHRFAERIKPSIPNNVRCAVRTTIAPWWKARRDVGVSMLRFPGRRRKGSRPKPRMSSASARPAPKPTTRM